MQEVIDGYGLYQYTNKLLDNGEILLHKLINNKEKEKIFINNKEVYDALVELQKHAHVEQKERISILLEEITKVL